MKRILSIDWDYFINATAHQRAMLFPDGGNENISYEIQDFIWNSHYSNPASKEELMSIGILKEEYNTLHQILRKFTEKYVYSKVANPYNEVLVTVSHSWIYNFIMQRTTKGETFEVYNVDFHHDMYNLNREEVNCGNWVNRLSEKRHRMKYFWVKRDDSDVNAPIGSKPNYDIKNLTDLKQIPFDYVFICRSDCWSPPHLDNYFETLWVLMRRYMPIEIENRISSGVRKCSSLSEIEERYAEQLAIAMQQV